MSKSQTEVYRPVLPNRSQHHDTSGHLLLRVQLVPRYSVGLLEYMNRRVSAKRLRYSSVAVPTQIHGLAWTHPQICTDTLDQISTAFHTATPMDYGTADTAIATRPPIVQAFKSICYDTYTVAETAVSRQEALGLCQLAGAAALRAAYLLSFVHVQNRPGALLVTLTVLTHHRRRGRKHSCTQAEVTTPRVSSATWTWSAGPLHRSTGRIRMTPGVSKPSGHC